MSLPVKAWWIAAKRAAGNSLDHRLSLTAAGVSFFGFLSLFPMIAAIVFIYGLVADVAQLQSHLNSLTLVLPPQALKILSDRLETIVGTPNTSGLSAGFIVSLILTFWSSSRGVAALVDVISVAYHQPDKRSFLRVSMLSVVLTLGMLVMLVVTLTLVAVAPLVLNYVPLPNVTSMIVGFVRLPSLLLLFCLGLCSLYKLAPDRKRARLAWVLPGACLATILWGLMSELFSVYLDNFGSYDATFGALAAVIVLLLWLYYSAFIVALGAEFNAELELLTRIDTTIGPSQPIGRRGAYVADHIRGLDL